MNKLSHRSPGMTAIFNTVKKNKKNQILDLGSCVSSNLNFYTKLGCRFHFENLNEVVNGTDSDSDISKSLDSVFSEVASGLVFDVVLVWDFLNFLPLPLIVKLFEKLEPFIHPNTFFYVVPYVGSRQPCAPCRFGIQDQYSVNIEVSDYAAKRSDKITSAAMFKSLPDIFVLRSYLNRDGMVPGFSEQVLSFQPEKAMLNSSFASAELREKEINIEKYIISPAIIRLNNNVGDNKTLLDLGVKNGINDDAWKRHYTDVYTQDVPQFLRRLQNLGPASRADIINRESFLNFDEHLRFDVIAVWDVLNYLDDDILFELGKRVVRYCHNDTKLFVMCLSGNEIPAQPQNYVMSDNTIGLSESDGTNVSRKLPTLTTVKILKAFPGFVVQDTFSSRPGMKLGLSEYIFSFKDAESQEQDRKALYEKVMARRKMLASQVSL